jgi:putative copper resistance protein D
VGFTCSSPFIIEEPALFLSSSIFVRMTSWYYISVWLHIIGGAFWIGGMLFLPLVLLPGIKDHPDRKNLLMATGLKFRFYGYIVLAMMFITGLLNIYLRGLSFSFNFFIMTRYGQLVELKIILFVLMITISLLHDLFVGRKAIEQTENQNIKLIARWTGRLLLLIALVMAYIGVVISRGG